jgi:iron complex outermembrane receptor protein
MIQHTLTRLLPLGLILGTATAQEAAPKPDAKPQELPEMVITAPKLGRDLLNAPVSATVTSGEVIEKNAIRTVKDAAIHAPSTFFTEFSARKLSNPRFRGIGSSPQNPGITTYMDGVPQLNANSSSLELLDIEQIDFVRGPLGALYGRNTEGGLINITSRRPSLDSFGGEFETTFGNYNLYDVRGRITTPLIQDQLGFSFAGGYNERDGYTKNTVTGENLDNRSAWFGKAQFLWQPSDELEIRFILAGESAQDGDYALNDLAALRRRPRESARDFVGYTERDVIMPTLQITYHADSFDFTSTTGFVGWETTDETDLDYQPFFLARRYNNETMKTWTQEFRFANPEGKPIALSDQVSLRWQAGLFLFHADYEQQTYNDFSAFVPGGPFRSLGSAQLTDTGVGAYAQGTLTLWDKLDITAGLRWDYEHKDADIRASTQPALGPTTLINTDSEFTQVTPQVAITYHLTPDIITYFSFAGGYKAGGFNAVGPVAFDEERSWNYEIGVKGRALDDKLGFGLAAFYTDWNDLQLNQPTVPPTGQFFIANAGDATSQGLELDLNYQLCDLVSVFGSASWQDTQFRSGAIDSGANLAGNNLPYAPDYTLTFGTQIEIPVTDRMNLYARADIQTIGSFDYNAQNSISPQDAYTLANFRLGMRAKSGWFAEAFVMNAFDTEYVPIAFNYGFAPSGAVGESGAPVTFGLRAGVKF